MVFRGWRKGQSDTFKLLIAAVVAMAILTIVASILGLINPANIGCVTNPLDDIASNIKKAQSGLEASTGTICLKSGEGFGEQALKDRVSGLKTVTVACHESASVCSGTGAPLTISGTSVKAGSKDVRFTVLITCNEDGGGGDYKCDLKIRSPSST